MIVARIIVAWFLAITTSALVIQRDATTVFDNFKKIDERATQLKERIIEWNGATINALAISGAASRLDEQIIITTRNLDRESEQSNPDSAKLLEYINKTLIPHANAALQALKSRKNNLDADRLTSTVAQALKALKNDIDSLGAALVKKVSSDQQKSSQAAVTKFDDSLATVMKAFG